MPCTNNNWNYWLANDSNLSARSHFEAVSLKVMEVLPPLPARPEGYQGIR